MYDLAAGEVLIVKLATSDEHLTAYSNKIPNFFLLQRTPIGKLWLLKRAVINAMCDHMAFYAGQYNSICDSVFATN